MDVARLLERINARHGTDFRLQGRYARGENHGAYAVADAAGVCCVLKWDRRPDRLAGLARARRITDRLGGLGAPVPTYRLAGTLPDGYRYWLQSALPGVPAARLTDRQLDQLLVLLELQAGQAVSDEQDWAAYVAAVVFDDASGWARTLRRHSAATSAVLGRAERLAAGKRACRRNRGDIVHGDLGLDNVLVEGDRISGIVDWDAAGCGDRVLDLAKLLFYSYGNRSVQARLHDRMLQLSGRDGVHVYLTYTILAQLDWSIRHHSQGAVDQFVALAHALLDDLVPP